LDDEIDALIEEIVTDTYGPAEQLWSFRQVFEDTTSFPFTAKVAGAPIEVIEIDFDGDERHGLSAICEPEGERHSVALLNIAPSASVTSDTRSLIDAYRRWSNAKPLAVDDSHQYTPPSTTTPDARPPSQALSSLVGDEHATVFTNLLDAHPELRDHAERLASESLSNVDIEHVAEAVQTALASIPLDEFGARTGRVRGGYVHETDAARDLIDEAIKPFRIDARRRATVGLPEAAAALATGIIAGLYRHRKPDEGTVVAYAGPDAIDSLVDEVRAMIEDLQLELADDAERRYWPEWSIHD
jgi:hypothetical protein